MLFSHVISSWVVFIVWRVPGFPVPAFFRGKPTGAFPAHFMEVQVNEEQRERTLRALAALMIDNKESRKDIRKELRYILRKVRSNISKDVRSYLDDDPRNAYMAVKSAVYRRILGGNVSIFSPRKAGRRCIMTKERKLDRNPHQRGGNRRRRSSRTEQLEGYYGKDRAFVLRFLNGGTVDRQTRFGRRGSVRATRLFEVPAAYHMDWAADALSNTLVTELEYQFNKRYK